MIPFQPHLQSRQGQHHHQLLRSFAEFSHFQNPSAPVFLASVIAEILSILLIISIPLIDLHTLELMSPKAKMHQSRTQLPFRTVPSSAAFRASVTLSFHLFGRYLSYQPSTAQLLFLNKRGSTSPINSSVSFEGTPLKTSAYVVFVRTGALETVRTGGV